MRHGPFSGGLQQMSLSRDSFKLASGIYKFHNPEMENVNTLHRETVSSGGGTKVLIL